MGTRMLGPPLVVTALLASATAAAAPTTHAVVVASHRPGPGQAPLQYAGHDASRMVEVLTEVGGVDADDVTMLVDPSSDELLAALSGLGATMADRDDSLFLFYYSGHARSTALDLGGDQLALTQLRQAIEAVPAKVSLVVMDACQAGALSTAKGVAPAADFSYNTVTGLDTAGMAVVASSTATELSQESAELQGSYFTHHWVTGLRGAADSNGDGAVSLTEAYDYTYARTLVSTSQTAIGGQHVTLETELHGQGDLVLSRPAAADARLSFAPALDGRILLVRQDTDTVTAEVLKRPGESFELALVPATYEALVRQGERTVRCEVEVAAGESLPFELGGCDAVALADTAGKGAGFEDAAEAASWFGGNAAERWMIELGVGMLGAPEDAYIERLYDFGFEPSVDIVGDATVQATAHIGMFRYFGTAVTAGTLDSGSVHREMLAGDDQTLRHTFSWQAWRIGVFPRLQAPIWHDRIVPYAQAGGGPAFARTHYEDGVQQVQEDAWALHLAGASGVQLMPNFAGYRVLGVYAQLEYSWAPVMHNLLDERHDSGGRQVVVGLRLGQ